MIEYVRIGSVGARCSLDIEARLAQRIAMPRPVAMIKATLESELRALCLRFCATGNP